MAVDNNLTETIAMSGLVTAAKALGETAPRAIVVARQQRERSIMRTVKIALVVTTNNETLIDGLIKYCLSIDNIVTFVGSDVNLQSDMEIDYLFFEAQIMAKTMEVI